MNTQRKRARNIRQALVLVGIVLAVVLYQMWSADASLLAAHFTRADGTTTRTFRLEIASTEPEREKGLMFRKEMKPHRGMLFIFPSDTVQSFWMKNTYISLDMIFVNSARRVVGVLENVPVLNEAPRTVGVPGQYVIELVAGAAKDQGIAVGAEFVPETPLPRGIP